MAHQFRTKHMHIIRGNDILVCNIINIAVGDRVHVVHEQLCLAAVSKGYDAR